MTTTAEPPTRPRPKQFIEGIGPLAAISLVVGTMIGSGIFIVSADIGRQVDAWGPGALMVVWVVTGLMTVTGALAYAELAAMMPEGGRAIHLPARRALPAGRIPVRLDPVRGDPDRHHRRGGGRVRQVPERADSRGHARCLPLARPPADAGRRRSKSACPISGSWLCCVVLVLTVLNARGVPLGARIQTVFAVAKVGALGVLILLGLTLLRRPEIAAFELQQLLGHRRLVARGAPGPGRRDGRSACSRPMPGTTSPSPQPRCRIRGGICRWLSASGPPRCRMLYVLANVAYLNLLPFHGDPNGADTIARGIQHAAQDRVGVAAAEVMFGPVGRGAHGDRDHAVDLRLRERTGSGGAAGLLRHGAGRALLRNAPASCIPTCRTPVSGWAPRRSGPCCSA